MHDMNNDIAKVLFCLSYSKPGIFFTSSSKFEPSGIR